MGVGVAEGAHLLTEVLGPAVGVSCSAEVVHVGGEGVQEVEDVSAVVVADDALAVHRGEELHLRARLVHNSVQQTRKHD